MFFDRTASRLQPRSNRIRHRWRLSATCIALISLTASGALVWSSSATALNTSPARSSKALADYPVGTPDTTEISGMAPPDATALPGYALTYETDFPGTTLPPGWSVFTGIPGGDPGGHFGASHVEVDNGVLELNTYRDPAWGNRWVTGGLCQCSVAHTYGAYFVRSRITGAGPNEVELLWPVTNIWPPEIDFNETVGFDTSTTSSVHAGKANLTFRRRVVIDMTQWHTWGLIWTPQEIIYTVDGHVWGTFKTAADIPHVPMDLNFEQRQQCEEHRQCPTAPETMQVNWVAEYRTD